MANIPGLIAFIIGAIIGGIIENYVVRAGDMVIAQFHCEDLNDNFKRTCELNKWVYAIGTKILFPIAGGISLFVGITKHLRK